MTSLSFAYYCSGHGYGHATRVSAFATHLLGLDIAPIVYIISSAPKHVFSQAIDHGAYYRNASIDPVIVQPLAYHVDRRKSVDVLKEFLSKEDQKIEQEVAWLSETKIDCVLSDAAYLACKAANMACIPSVLITNFTFDSVYSYLSIQFSKASPYNPLILPQVAGHRRETGHSRDQTDNVSLHDEIISPEELRLLVDELHMGYRCAELLIRLPGNIPIPSFGTDPTLPSHLWTDAERNAFRPCVMDALSRNISSESLHPSIPFPVTAGQKTKVLPRKVLQGPLIVRHPSSDAYTAKGRKRLLGYVGVPERLQGPNTKILIVSFGGQVFRKPASRTPSRSHSPTSRSGRHSPIRVTHTLSAESNSSSGSSDLQSDDGHLLAGSSGYVHVRQTIATPSHLWIPGAPPASKPRTTPAIPSDSTIPAISDLPNVNPRIELIRTQSSSDTDTDSSCEDPITEDQPHSDAETDETEPDPPMLPDPSWIAIVCGATPAPKGPNGETEDDEMPENFFVAPRDVYMPDLTAIADVLLGKLGYGTVSECVDACTPFVYVPRPLFIEEHGLRRLLNSEGVGVELSREKYEDGDWAKSVHEAWERGKEKKAWKRRVGEDGARRREGEGIAKELVGWVQEWKRRDAETEIGQARAALEKLSA